jgi:hypothetical protein
MDFMVKSSYLPDTLEKLDTDQNNTLTPEQVLKAFESAYGPPGLTAACIRTAATELGAMQGGLINYKIMVR